MHKQLAIFGSDHRIQQRLDGSRYCICNPDPDSERECWALKRYDEEQWIERIRIAKRKDLKPVDYQKLILEPRELAFASLKDSREQFERQYVKAK